MEDNESASRLKDFLNEFLPKYKWTQNPKLRPFKKHLLYGAYLFHKNPHFRRFDFLPVDGVSLMEKRIGELTDEFNSKIGSWLKETRTTSSKDKLPWIEKEFRNKESYVDKIDEFNRFFRKRRLHRVIDALEDETYGFPQDFEQLGEDERFLNFPVKFYTILNEPFPPITDDIDNDMENIKKSLLKIPNMEVPLETRRDRSYFTRMLLTEYMKDASVTGPESFKALVDDLNYLTEHEDRKSKLQEMINTHLATSGDYFDQDGLYRIWKKAQSDIGNLNLIFGLLIEDSRINLEVFLTMYIFCRKFENTESELMHDLVNLLDQFLRHYAEEVGANILGWSEYWGMYFQP